jgi:hypothetical protein
MDLYSVEKESSAPDFDELDKLIRNQTLCKDKSQHRLGSYSL